MLERLFAGSLEDARAREQLVSRTALEKRVETQPAPIDVAKLFADSKNISVIAEIKRASPSKGALAEIEDVPKLATLYEDSGAAAISVLTEGRAFKGSLADFDQARAAVSLPLLRKDFIASEYQVLEARAHGADMVLLIVAGLETEKLKNLHEFIKDLGMTALVETHSESEILVAQEIGAKLIGINARDLSTFETDSELFIRLVSSLPSDVVKIAESAIRTVEDVRRYSDAGADAVLVGEALVTGNAESLLREFSAVTKA